MLPQKKVQWGVENTTFSTPHWQCTKNSRKIAKLIKLWREPQGARNVRFWRATRRWKGNCLCFLFVISQRPHEHFLYIMHTRGTSIFFSKLISKWCFSLCLVCAYNVPVVCTYFFDKTILKYGIRAFQRRVARRFTTQTRCCSSILNLGALKSSSGSLGSKDEFLMSFWKTHSDEFLMSFFKKSFWWVLMSF